MALLVILASAYLISRHRIIPALAGLTILTTYTIGYIAYHTVGALL